MLLSCVLTTPGVGDDPRIRFSTDVVPVLTKLGCNSGGCHGKATGQNGFRLSLLGFEPEFDHQMIVKAARGRRIALAAPERSLLLLKATNQVPHGGGRRTSNHDAEYQVLRRWIAEGVVAPSAADPRVERIVLASAREMLAKQCTHPLQVTAYMSDGSRRDVTRQAVYETNEPELATVSAEGIVSTLDRAGLFAVMVRYGGKIATFHATVPTPLTAKQLQATSAQFDALQAKLGSPVDRALLGQWRRLALTPSAVASDATFIRRASLDICGTLPTRDEVESYVADKRTDKRQRLIDRLLERPEYASYFTLKWADILQNRGSGYSTRQQRAGTALFSGWIRDALAANRPYDEFAAEILTASGSQNENPPTVWYRQVRAQSDYVESVAQAFLGVRIQCAQCHHHPFDRWSQDDYYGLAAVFARVGRKGGFADAEVPTNEVIFVKDQGRVEHPRTGESVDPKALGGPVFDVGRFDDPRRKLARWMTAAENPFFARAFVNRIWAHFHGRGIIHPIDDARDSNPPTKPELLDALSRGFVESGYDVKQLIRTVCNAYSYRLEATPNQNNGEDTQTFARYYAKRLPAEVLLDGISQVLDVPTQFAGGPGEFVLGTRAIELPDENVPASFLDVFGRPGRTSACECERVDAPSLAQALTLVNSAEIQRKLTSEQGYATRIASNEKSHVDNVEDIFLRLLGRPPTDEESKTAVSFLKNETERAAAYQSLLWSLLATNEFMFNH
ncbi:MAG: S-layer protein [Blastopirellula sp.]|nr:S-layer protein [Blastopirellula sp.]